jgi:hypothetical protein
VPVWWIRPLVNAKRPAGSPRPGGRSRFAFSPWPASLLARTDAASRLNASFRTAVFASPEPERHEQVPSVIEIAHVAGR